MQLYLARNLCPLDQSRGTNVKYRQWLKLGGSSAHLLRFEPYAVNEKCSFMHKMCQIPHPIDASVV